LTFPSPRFIDSEADLDSTIKSLLPLAQAPALAYPELIRSGAVDHLINLLSHENADIMIDVVDLVHELTDEDVGNEAEEDHEEQNPEAALKALIESLVGFANIYPLLFVLNLDGNSGRAFNSGAFG
jgi:beta-catenin-like protein 1